MVSRNVSDQRSAETIKEEQEYEGLHFEGGLLTEAIKSTFDRRGTEAPAGTPLGL